MPVYILAAALAAASLAGARSLAGLVALGLPPGAASEEKIAGLSRPLAKRKVRVRGPPLGIVMTDPRTALASQRRPWHRLAGQASDLRLQV